MKYSLFALIVLFLHSCSIEKRKYTRGYYMHRSEVIKTSFYSESLNQKGPVNSFSPIIPMNLSEFRSAGIMKVPEILFSGNPKHISVLKDKSCFPQKYSVGTKQPELIYESQIIPDSVKKSVSEENADKKIRRNRIFKKILIGALILTNFSGSIVTVPLLLINAKRYKKLIQENWTEEQLKADALKRMERLTRAGKRLRFWVVFGTIPISFSIGYLFANFMTLFGRTVIGGNILIGALGGFFLFGFLGGIAAFFLYAAIKKRITGIETPEMEKQINRIKTLRFICLLLMILSIVTRLLIPV